MEVDTNKKYIWANETGYDFFGDDVIGKKVDYYFEGDQKTYEKVDPVFSGTSDTIYVESWQRRKDGEKRLLAWWCRTLRDINNNIIGSLSSARDITETKLLEESLIESNIKNSAILSSIREGVFACNQEGIILEFNKMAEELTGYHSDEVIGKHYKDVINFDLEKELVVKDKTVVEAALQNELSAHDKIVLKTRNNKNIPISATVSPLRNASNEEIGKVVIFRDSTQERQVDFAKTEFISLASHEMRTPLSMINWYSEMLLAGDVGELKPEQKEYATTIYESSKRMVELVNSLLNVSRLELGTFAIEPELVKVIDIAQTCIKGLKPTIQEKGLNLKESYDPSIPNIKADPKLLDIIIRNLLANAIKYSYPKGEIDLAIRKDKDFIVIEVKDQGIGIPKDQQSKIFTKLFRADNARVINPEGAGLGLYIIHEILEYTKGEIWFKSKENEGTTFYAKIPLIGMDKKIGSKQLV